MKLTFRKKALLIVLPILGLVSAVYTLDSIMVEKDIMRREIIKRAEAVTTLATKTGELPILSGNPELLKGTAAFLRANTEVVSVAFYDNKMFQLINDGVPIQGEPPVLSSGSPISMFDTPDLFVFFAPVFTVRAADDIDIFQEASEAKQVREGIGWVRLGFSKSAMREAANRIVMRGSALAVIFTAGSSILVFFLITAATRPLTLLFNAVKRIEKGEYPDMNIIPSSDEIGELAVAFDKMSKAIRDRELRLVESENRIRELFERVEHAIFRLDREGNIIETNRKFNEICGGVNRFCAMFGGKEEGLRLRKAIEGGFRSSEEKLAGSDGEEVDVIMSVYPKLDNQGEVLSFDGYFVDITEKKRLEERLIQKQKLDSLGMLAGGIAHDFNNILTGVVGYASLMRNLLPEDGKISRYAATIEKSATRATNLTSQLLGFARKGKYEIKKFNVNDLIKEMTGFLKETIDRNISIVVDAESNLPPIAGDSNQLYQSLLNLCLNARDAMPDGGKLYIKTEFYLLNEEQVIDFFRIPAGEYVRISVTDTGKGMTPEVKKRIFEPFYTTKMSGKGTGLGLAMVYGIIKNHGGHISVYSEPELGTTL
ncbi:MAG: PAS domain S-box protein, partial [Deltaproteobacteria bacterium]|nr:PAS domain S-box protein [Deltaproteobacteria bacterium]